MTCEYFQVKAKAPDGRFKGGVLESESTSSTCVVSVHISVTYMPSLLSFAAAFSQATPTCSVGAKRGAADLRLEGVVVDFLVGFRA